MKLPAVGRDVVLEIENAETIGAADRHALFGKRHQPSHPRRAMTSFAEACREHDRGTNTALEGLLKNVACCIGRNRKHDGIDRLRQIADRSKARAAMHLLVVRVDREQIALESDLLQI